MLFSSNSTAFLHMLCHYLVVSDWTIGDNPIEDSEDRRTIGFVIGTRSSCQAATAKQSISLFLKYP
ncbi:hypothetical protein [Chamaesiphon sp. VAR_48_metabat_403]|uniref:hypothetical protein n=1 Tax=Chamaesiphon sp. VAR_48_metabat_403 TaxID=2964700 RepID=UPI00286E570F|nr:hypothetical protein [Chamaesiphon sp. VAR_48_metabat_403]